MGELLGQVVTFIGVKIMSLPYKINSVRLILALPLYFLIENPAFCQFEDCVSGARGDLVHTAQTNQGNWHHWVERDPLKQYSVIIITQYPSGGSLMPVKCVGPNDIVRCTASITQAQSVRCRQGDLLEFLPSGDGSGSCPMRTISVYAKNFEKPICDIHSNDVSSNVVGGNLPNCTQSFTCSNGNPITLSVKTLYIPPSGEDSDAYYQCNDGDRHTLYPGDTTDKCSGPMLIVLDGSAWAAGQAGMLEAITQCGPYCTVVDPTLIKYGTLEYAVGNGASCSHNFNSSDNTIINTFLPTDVDVSTNNAVYYSCNQETRNTITSGNIYSCPQGQTMSVAINGSLITGTNIGKLKGIIVPISVSDSSATSRTESYLVKTPIAIIVSGSLLLILLFI